MKKQSSNFFGYSGFQFKNPGSLYHELPGLNPGTRNPGFIPTPEIILHPPKIQLRSS